MRNDLTPLGAPSTSHDDHSDSWKINVTSSKLEEPRCLMGDVGTVLTLEGLIFPVINSFLFCRVKPFLSEHSALVGIKI